MSQTRNQYIRELKLEPRQPGKTGDKPKAGLEAVVVLGQVSMFGRTLSRRAATPPWATAGRWNSSRPRVAKHALPQFGESPIRRNDNNATTQP